MSHPAPRLLRVASRIGRAIATALALLVIGGACLCVILSAACNGGGRQGTVEISPAVASSQPVENALAGLVNVLAAIDAAGVRVDEASANLAATGIAVDALRADVAGLRLEVGAVRTEQRAGRDAISTVRTNNPWPLVAMAALLSPSPAGLWRYVRQWRRSRGRRKVRPP